MPLTFCLLNDFWVKIFSFISWTFKNLKLLCVHALLKLLWNLFKCSSLWILHFFLKCGLYRTIVQLNFFFFVENKVRKKLINVEIRQLFAISLGFLEIGTWAIFVLLFVYIGVHTYACVLCTLCMVSFLLAYLGKHSC